MPKDPIAPSEPLPMRAEDWYLQFFVNMVNGGDTEIPVTLLVGGAIVGGQLASGHRYFEETGATLLPEGINGEAAESFKTFTRMNAEIYTTDEGKEKMGQPTFIHLRDAKYFHHSGAPIPTNHGIWWRGRLSEVDGWSFGTLSHQKL